MATGKLQPSTVLGPAGIEVSRVRTSESAVFPHHSYPIIQQITSKIAALVGLPLHFAEPLQVLRYQTGEKFVPHFDSYDLSSFAERTQVLKNGQRIMTVILYLNTVEEGGQTAFPLLKLAVTPWQGSVLVFENCKKGTNKTHPLSFHESRPVIKGEKWVGVLWFREKAQYEGGKENDEFKS